jgi:hypothetical protein
MVGEVMLSSLDTAQPMSQACSGRGASKGEGRQIDAEIMLALHEAGHELLVPFGENTRYDLAIDDGSRLARVQCKTGRLRQGPPFGRAGYAWNLLGTISALGSA